MLDQNQNQQGGSIKNSDVDENGTTTRPNKLPFVEPEISQPVDVLEATTFFQAVDSGPTN